MTSFLEQLYDSIDFSMESENDANFETALDEWRTAQSLLRESFCPKQEDLFSDYIGARMRMEDCEKVAHFRAGYALAIRALLSGLV